MRGRNFPEMSELSSSNSCIPPTLSCGRMAMAVTMIPIPPIHCRIARHSKIPRGMSSSPVSTVAPVVVRPEIDSNMASVKLMPSARNGIAAIMGRNTQTRTVSRNPSR